MRKYAFAGVILVCAALGAYFLLVPKGQLRNEPISQTMKNNNNAAVSSMTLKSSAFGENDPIPSRFTCDGENVNPFLEIKGAPRDAKSLALIVDDPDATNGKTWNHWLLWNIDPHTQYISEGSLPQGAVEGTTSFGAVRYGGPCPPRGNPAHRYQFKLYALDTTLELPEGALKSQVLTAIQGHVMAEAVLTGRYGRK